MRINVYAEEITDEVEVVTKEVEDNEFGKRVFFGLRFFLKSPPDLHHSEEDDDRTAITMWLRWTRANGNDPQLISNLLTNMRGALEEIIHLDRRAAPLAPSMEDIPAAFHSIEGLQTEG